MAAWGKPRPGSRRDLWIDPLALIVVIVAAFVVFTLLAGGGR